MECVSHSVGRFPFGKCTCALSTEKIIAEETVTELLCEAKENFFPFGLLSIYYLFPFQYFWVKILQMLLPYSQLTRILSIFSELTYSSF